MQDSRTFSFAETLIAPEHVVCSFILKPFSLGHWSFLEAYQSPLLSESLYPEEISNDPNENYLNCIRHILLFILVCSHTYEDNTRLIEDAAFYQSERQEFEKHMVEYIKKKEQWNIFAEITQIKEYLGYYINSMPEFVEKGPSSPQNGVDWKSNIYSVLKNECGYSQSEVMNMSIRRLYAEWVTIVAKSGSIEVKTKEAILAEQQAKKLVEDIRAGKVKLTEKGELVQCQPQV